MKISIQISSGDRIDADHLLEEAQEAIFNGETSGSIAYQKGDRLMMNSIYILKTDSSYAYVVIGEP